MKQVKSVWKLSALGMLALFSMQAHAAGFKIEFQSASVLADAGEAAVVEDAGTNWYNSAGLVYLPRQMVVSAIDVFAPVKFTGAVFAPSVGGSNFATTGTASSNPNTIIPGFHLSIPLSQNFAYGISVVPAWGFTEDYSENSILRYSLTRIYTRTLDIAPSIAWKINNQWSFGIGPDIHYFSVESKSHVRTQVITAGDSSSRFSANSWNVAGHVGVLYRPTEQTRIGVNYRSQLLMNTRGYSGFTLDGISYTETNDFRLPLQLPPVTTLSVYHDMNPCWALMGTLSYEQWSSIRDFHGRNYAQPGSVLSDVSATQNMGDTLDASIGTHIRVTDNFMFRGSLKYLPTPTKNMYREVNFPDGVKYGINLGGRYQINPALAVDVIYGHVFVKAAHINDVNPATFATANGYAHTTIDLLGAQLVWNL